MIAAKRRSPILAIVAALMFVTFFAPSLAAGQHGPAAGKTSQVTTSSSGGAGQAAPTNLRMDIAAPSNLRMDVINNLRMD